ncbi:hypothetical protein [Leptolyngbya ohadii]|uniref:hypothetical protein n=1 Tax=Leptolyngbya ohadii TaxID=1962290 RepID=UPI00117B33EA|nr:hypothetical protein [Leptolyngbya ohadii]
MKRLLNTVFAPSALPNDERGGKNGLNTTGFTVYHAPHCITLRPGCADIPGWRVICSYRLYEQALEAAQNAAIDRQLPLRTHN